MPEQEQGACVYRDTGHQNDNAKSDGAGVAADGVPNGPPPVLHDLARVGFIGRSARDPRPRWMPDGSYAQPR
jgi:hypothetical protein